MIEFNSLIYNDIYKYNGNKGPEVWFCDSALQQRVLNHSSFFIKTEARIEIRRIEIIIPSEVTIGISKWKYDESILRPTNERTNASPTFRKRKYPIIPAMAKYKERKPKIAKIFEVYTINMSLLIASMAGMLSTANIRSEDSIIIRTRNNGVA